MAKDFAIITPEAAREIQARAEKRNALAHLNVKKLRKGVRPPSDDIGWGGLVIEWREGTLGHPKMQKEALRALKLASVLCEKFYGPPPNHQ
ncbi:MAG: hypothetical protein HY685_02130 [Chloroflexi bacterium]|nr:hypothetical protein [Chloroflexota bacterium]